MFPSIYNADKHENHYMGCNFHLKVLFCLHMLKQHNNIPLVIPISSKIKPHSKSVSFSKYCFLCCRNSNILFEIPGSNLKFCTFLRKVRKFGSGISWRINSSYPFASQTNFNRSTMNCIL